MIFESNENIYEVINVLYSGVGYDNYRCDKNNENYILSCIKTEELKHYMCQMLVRIQETTQFHEIYEVFTYNDDFVIVLKEHQVREKWSDYLIENDYTFRERIEFLYRILSGLCVHEVPVEIACDLMKHGEIGISADGSVNCYYNLRELDDYKTYDTMEQFCGIFSHQIWNVFGDEIMRKPYKELRSFYDDIQKNIPKDFLELFKRYNEVYEIFLEKIEKHQLTENAEINKFQGLMEKSIRIAKKVVVAAVIAAAVWVLILSLRNSSTEAKGAFSQIGDLRIKEYVPPEK